MAAVVDNSFNLFSVVGMVLHSSIPQKDAGTNRPQHQSPRRTNHRVSGSAGRFSPSSFCLVS